MAQPLLKRFEITLFRDNSPTDNTQVPATNATIDICRQGATLKTAFTFPAIYNDPVSIEVYDVGRISPGDTLHVFQGGLSVGSLLVDSIPDSSHLNVLNSAPMSGNVNERLIVTNARPVISWNPLGASSGLHYQTTDPVTGRASGYVREERFDFIASGTGFTPRVFPDAEGGIVQEPPGVFDIRDFGGNIQEILDLISEAFPAGGIIHIPKGLWEQEDTLFVKGGRVIIEGEGHDTRVIGKDKDTHVFEVVPQSGLSSHAYDILFRDLMIQGNSGGEAGDGDGIHWEGGEEPSRGTEFHMDHVAIVECGNDGLYLKNVNFPVIIDCSFNNNRGNGASLLNVAQSMLLGYYANLNRYWGLYCEDAGGHFVQANGIEGNHAVAGEGATDGQLKLKNCGGVIIRSAFESFAGEIAKTAIDLEGARNVVVEGCSFAAGSNANTVGISIRGGCKGVTIGTNGFNKCWICVDARDEWSTGVIVMPQEDNGANGDIVAYPTGENANGWQGLVALVQNPVRPSEDTGMKVPGIRIPFIARPPEEPPNPPVPGHTGFPAVDDNNEGTLVYHRYAMRGQRLKLSDGTDWWPIGGAPSFTDATRPTDLGPGTLIWVIPNSNQSLQVSDGSGGWKVVPLDVLSTGNAWSEEQEFIKSQLMDGIAYAPQTPTPTLPGAGKIKLFTEGGCSRANPAFVRSEGRMQWQQGMVGWNGGCAILPGTGATPNVWGTALGTAVGTVSHPAPGSTGLLASTRLVAGSSASTANAAVTIFENQVHTWRGNAAGRGGFYLCARFALFIDTETDTQFGFVGLAGQSSSIGNTAPTNLTNALGIGAEPGDSNILQIVHNDSSGTATKISLGSGFGTLGGPYQLELYCPPNGNAITYRVMNLDDTSVAPATGTITTDVPSNTTFLAFHIHANTGTTGGVPAGWKLVRAQIECDV